MFIRLLKFRKSERGLRTATFELCSTPLYDQTQVAGELLRLANITHFYQTGQLGQGCSRVLPKICYELWALSRYDAGRQGIAKIGNRTGRGPPDSIAVGMLAAICQRLAQGRQSERLPHHKGMQ